MKMFLFIAAVLVSQVGFASQRVINIDVYKNSAELDRATTNVQIYNVSVKNVDKVVRITEDENCSSDEAGCTSRQVLQTEKVVQVTLSYEGDAFMDGESSTAYVDLNLPVSSFDLKRSLKSQVKLTNVMAPKTVQSLDALHSKLCSTDDGADCVEDLHYVTRVIQVREVSVSIQ